MPNNWIRHLPSTTPPIKTTDDIQHVPFTHISEFFLLVRNEFLHGATQSGGFLPHGLFEAATAYDPSLLASVLRAAIAEGNMMDSGWIDDYFCICERASGVMGGYPKVCLQQWREVRDALTGAQLQRDNSFNAPSNAYKKEINDPRRIFRFLDLPSQIRQQIYRLVIPNGTLTVSDWAFSSFPSTVLRRTEYDVVDVNNVPRRTTYAIMSSSPSNPQLNLGLMLTNRSIARETSEILYASKFEFRGTASSTLAFFHDHMARIKWLTRISLRYTTTSKTPFMGVTSLTANRWPPTLKTDHVTWTRILSVLVNSASALEDFELVVEKNFWLRAPWRSGVQAVLKDRALCERNSQQAGMKNFVVDVSRLSDVNFRLTIESCGDNEERKMFQRGLEKAVYEKMRKTPYLADKEAACECRRRLLSESCIRKSN